MQSSYPAHGQAAAYGQTQGGQVYEIQLQGHKLDKKDFLGKSDPFFILKAAATPGLNMGGSQALQGTSHQVNPFKKKKDKSHKKDKGVKKLSKKSGGWVIVHKSETIMNNLNPTWRPFTINTAQLCNNNFDQPFVLEVWDWDNNGSHDLIGTARATLRELMTLKEARLINDKRIGFSDTAGMIQVLKCGPTQQQASTPASSAVHTTVQTTQVSHQAGGYPPQTGGYPPQQQGYPSHAGYPQQGYPPPPQSYGGYPPMGGYPPQQQMGYPPQQMGYPPQQVPYGGGYPPQQQMGYPPQQMGYPPQQMGGYPPQTGGYPPAPQ